MSRRITPVVVLAVLGAIAGAPSAPAATTATAFEPFVTPNPSPQVGARWGERLAVAADENGDGVNDIFTATPSADLAFPDQGRVYLLSGKDRSIIRVIDSPEPQGGTAFGFSATSGAKFGFFISVPGDLNGDGKDDVVVGTDAQNVFTGTGTPCGTPEPNGCNEGQGKAWSFSGATGAVLKTFDNPDPQGTPTNRARFGSRIGSAGDVTGDGVPDIVIGASSNDVPAGCGDVTTVPPSVPAGCRKDQGQAYIFNGATGSLERRLDLPDQDPATCLTNCGQLGLAVQSPGDTNGDGFPDQLVDAGTFNGVGRMYLFSGKNGNVLLRIDDPEPQPAAFFGFQDVAPNSPGDVNGDGAPDLYAHGFQQDVNGVRDQGRGWVFSGKTGALIYTIDDPTPTAGGTFGFSMSKTDYNKDATPDLYIGQAPHGGGDENGGTYVVDGRNGSLLKALELPTADRQANNDATTMDGGPSLGFSSAAAGDLNGDGEGDYLGGTPFFNEAGVKDSGRIYTFLSKLEPSGPPGNQPPGNQPPGNQPPGNQPPPGGPSGCNKFTSKLSLARATFNRADRTISILAPITRLASGSVQITLFAARTRRTFNAKIDSRNGRIRVTRRITAAQAQLGTGILTIRYRGDSDTRPQNVRLRAANNQARLNVTRPTITSNGFLRASGSVTSRARGVVRVQLEYVNRSDGQTVTLERAAKISNGRWSLNSELSPSIRSQIARRCGTVHSYTLFTGYFPRRIRGEQRSLEVLPSR